MLLNYFILLSLSLDAPNQQFMDLAAMVKVKQQKQGDLP